MATDFTYGGKQIVSGGPFKPGGKDMPSDARTRVDCYADIATIPNPYVGLKITVKVDETNNNKMTDYIVKSLKANSIGAANSLIDEVERYVDYLGASSNSGSVSQEDIKAAVNDYLEENPVQSGATVEQAAQIEANKTAIGDENSGLIKEVNDIKNTELQNLNTAILRVNETVGNKSELPVGDENIIASINRIDNKQFDSVTDEQAQQLTTAYEHSQSAHVQSSDIPTKISELENDSVFTTETYVDNAIDTALDGHTFKFLTQAEYDALETKDPLVEYRITDAADVSANYYTKPEIDEKIENAVTGNVDLTSYASDLMLSGDKLQLKNKNGALIGSSIHLPLNSSGDSGLEFTNENVTSSINTDIDETKTRQEYLGGYIEVQPDQWDGSTPSYDATSNTWGFPYSLNLSDQKKIRELVFHGNNTNIRYIRFPLGFAYRGYRNIDKESKLARNIGERYKGQNQSLKRWFKEIAEAGGGLAPEYWCPPPHWLTSGAYVGGATGNFISAGGSYDRTTKLASIKTSDPTQYAKQIDDFTNAIIDDLEYLHTNICPVRMFGLQNEPGYSNMRYGACAYDKQTYNDVLEVLYPKILASEILSFYGDEPNEVKLLVASDDGANPFLGIAKTFIDNHSDWIWGYTHHLMRRASGEHDQFGATGADWFKTENFKTVKGELDNVFINEYEYFGDNFTDEFRCSNNMLRLIFEAVYSGAKVMHPVIHICKPIAQSLASTNTRGYCMFACNLPGSYGVDIEHSTNPDRIPQGGFVPNKIYWHSWSMFGDNLPVNSTLVGYYTKKLDGVGWCCFRNANKFYLFLANNTEETKSVTIDFYSNLSFDGKYYDINNCGTKLKTKSGTAIEFVIPPTSGQCWIEQGSHSIITPPEFVPSDYATNGICYYTKINIDSTTGGETSATDRVSTQYISVSGETVTTKLNYNLGIRFYDKDKFFIGSKSVAASSSNVVTTLEEGTKYIRLVIVTEPTNVSGKTLVSDGVSYTLTASTSQPTKTLTSISAVYNQGSTVIYPDTTLDSLKSNLTVTATYSDNSTSNITNYSLSGTLSVGASNVTVTYSGKTTTFTVNVIAKPTLESISATYNQGVNIIYPSTSLNSLKSDLVVTANYSDGSQETITDYTLSGTLTAGTSTVTVTYNSKTTTFNVIVTEEANDNGYVSGYINDNNEIATLDSTYTANAYKPIQGRLVIVDAPSTLSGIRIAEYNEDKQYITRQSKTGSNVNGTKFIVSENCRYIRVSLTVTDKSTSNLDNIFSNYTVEPEYTIINCELGGIASSDGTLTGETDRYRTIEAMEYLSSSHDNLSFGMTYIAREYDDSDNYLGTASTSFISAKYNVKNSNTTKLRLVIKPTNTSVDRTVFKLGNKYYLMKLN